jgi:KipI family sensor histidine kinase inhibitor
MNVRRSGERAAILDCDDDPPAAVAAALRELAATKGVVLAEVVPGAVTVLVAAVDAGQLAALLTALPELEIQRWVGETPTSSAIIEVPVRYDGPDLTTVASVSGLSVSEVVRLHSAATYHAAFTGFAPGFAYLTGLDPRLVLPRRHTPRPSVPAGSVAIADVYTAVYPRQSPGGWHLIGTTEAVMFDPASNSPALITPGSRVRFVPVQEDQIFRRPR